MLAAPRRFRLAPFPFPSSLPGNPRAHMTRSLATSAATPATLLLTPSKLSSLLSAPHNILPIDATWFMPNVPRNPRQEFRAKRIPGARFWDVDDVATKGESVRGLPHMMPGPVRFAEAASALGISPDTHVVVYDSHGVFSSPRTAFTFMAFSHPQVSVLDGGLPAWEAEGLSTESGEQQAAERTTYPTPTFSANLIRNYPEMLSLVSSPTAHPSFILDARPAPRFHGTAPEPRPGLSSGHMPGALSLPFSSLVDSHQLSSKTGEPRSYTTLKNPKDLREALVAALGAGDEKLGEERLNELLLQGKKKKDAPPQVVTTCGSGMTAAVVWLALKRLGVEGAAIYDESWMGWASRQESPIVKT